MHSLSPAPIKGFSSAIQWLLGAAALVIVLGGLKAISHIVTPFLLAAFLAIICAPPLDWMQRRKLPGPLAVLVLFSVVGLTFFLLFLALKDAAEGMASQAPLYQARFNGWLIELREMIAARGLPAELLPSTLPLPAAATITGIARGLAGGLGQFTASTLLVLLAFMFLLLEERYLSDKLDAAFPRRRRARVRTRRFLRSVYRYLLIKTAASTATGVIIGSGLTFMGVDFALLWGIVAGLLNFIPTIGSIIAAIPAVIIAFMGMGIVEGLLVLLLYVAVNTGIGSIIEPRLMGSSLGISPLVVLVSLLIWGYVFGPIGMLLAVPLTMIAKLALDASPETRWAGILMSDSVKRLRD
ncbi:AI-2E family transporter [Halopseudomonas pelagia]|uniref:AI-2E family transporter n=1 Tax=Halopseudomonas pelagia TaxID=553151 RepID=UPI0003A8008B|nr:AI-2E family transporter [Halopseudomonas pelagia]|tara:strand:- start:74906 stop:75967 length:1062 start_codon:yes stop_codon:yes gene_type:complete